MTRLDKIKLLEEKEAEVRKAQMAYTKLEGEFNEQMAAFLRSEGIPEKFSLLQLIKKMSPASPIILPNQQ